MNEFIARWTEPSAFFEMDIDRMNGNTVLLISRKVGLSGGVVMEKQPFIYKLRLYALKLMSDQVRDRTSAAMTR